MVRHWEEEVTTFCKVQHEHLRGERNEHYENHRDSKQILLKYNSE